ncbi:TatD-related deoxyribonuclease [Pseudopedobacter saltans DSM 12145]|uniref:TatD-related deoxyribonuclease n=1 Tax=Pseudopedobacter saltans (strain ATCC 51119 / DSM 12145 / JCM 21818 / CCUG 39354 / LMG 10337 / NBRC 100064 / NCIMB 13643) TaxID=762903 RepID=F0SBN9_PSESL|nr:TatD family hydrolase [Pseudopedobacter saltans]ADY52730.1 TatD-related deoxyribonuclease [Pseudopedobacter saltans DSM 12145]
MPLEKKFINIHSHRKPQSADEWVLRNAFHKLSTDRVKGLNYFVSVGLHPWYVDSTFEQKIEHVTTLLTLPNVLAMGEIGLDRACTVDFDLQRKAFEIQIELAETHNLPVIIHAVRTYSDLIRYLKKSSVTFILHQYRGNEEQTRQLLQLDNVFFSFGIDLINHDKVKRTFLQIPLNKVFLETDVADLSIQSVYKEAAFLLGKNTTELQEHIYKTFKSISHF